MEKGIKKLKRILAGEKETPFTSREYMTLFTYPQLLHFSFVEFPFTCFIIIFNHLVLFILIIFLNCNYYRTVYNMCCQKGASRLFWTALWQVQRDTWWIYYFNSKAFGVISAFISLSAFRLLAWADRLVFNIK